MTTRQTSLHLGVQSYQWPLRRPWRSARGLRVTRDGWLLRAEVDGSSGFGDCAPLPEAGTEIAEEAERRLCYWRGRAGDGVAALLAALDSRIGSTPAADCAVETALLDLDARTRGLPLRRLLRPDAPDRIEVSAMLGAAATLETFAVEQVLAAGHRVLKLKVGTAPLDVEMPRIQAAAALLPAGARLRLDANGAWDHGAAAAWIERLRGLPIDCLEEPLAEPDDAALADLQEAAPWSLAMDESLAGRADIDPRQLPVRRLVLKPQVQGGLRRTLRLAEQAQAAGREVVTTSLLESAAGLWATAQLAAAIGSPLAHGLATADWLAADLGTPPRIEGGAMHLPPGPGSGFVPYPNWAGA